MVVAVVVSAAAAGCQSPIVPSCQPSAVVAASRQL